MKTYFEVDKATGNKYKEKPGIMTIYSRDPAGGQPLVVGSSPVNWADFVERKMHKVQIPLSMNIMDGINKTSYIQLEVETQEEGA